ncbi:MAG: pilin [Patescibacteria group bacterium]|jgi:hypothetical protein
MKKILTFALLAFPAIANAQAPAGPTLDDWGYNKLEGKVNLGQRPLEDTIGGVINVILGFLGILTTLIILWGGFKWMTSYGSSDKIDEAKKLIQAGIIGLVIVLTAYAISRYVILNLFQQTV